jgi:hypothetical protein
LGETILQRFFDQHRERIARCRAKVAERGAPQPVAHELWYGIPLFLDQRIGVLRLPRAAAPPSPRRIQRISRAFEIGRTAAQHGNELLRRGLICIPYRSRAI